MAWQDLAREMAGKIGLDPRVLIATVQAETSGRNVPGDSGNATGYGQVWLKWHYDSLVKAAKLVGVPVPANNLQAVQAAVLSNDRLSMAWTAYTVQHVWSGTGNYDKFTKAYVGKNIPAADYERRKKIWDSVFASSTAAPGAVPVTNATQTKQELPGVFKLEYAGIPIVILAGAAAVALLSD